MLARPAHIIDLQRLPPALTMWQSAGLSKLPMFITYVLHILSPAAVVHSLFVQHSRPLAVTTHAVHRISLLQTQAPLLTFGLGIVYPYCGPFHT